jgi:malonyl CoA-acyl carrier protein transacylase
MIACAFGGQGTQHSGMGTELFAHYPELVKIADGILGYSLTDLCRQGGSRLNRTECTQPAVFAVNAMMYLEHRSRSKSTPCYLLGHSLGELSALYAADVFDFETGLRIVKRRGELMSLYSDEGSMAALVGPRDHALLLISQESSGLYLAIDNSPQQIVVAGTARAISELQNRRQSDQITVVPLQVSGPFHSPLMRRARDEFRNFLEKQSFNQPKVPVVANISALPYTTDGMRDTIADLLVSPVRWFDSIDYLAQRGPMLFAELGPRPILSPLIRQILLDFGRVSLS